MNRVRLAIAALVAIAGISAVVFTAPAASAAPTLVREYQVTQMAISFDNSTCTLQSASGCSSASVLVTVTVPSCVKARSLTVDVFAPADEETQITVVGNPPAKCRSWTPTSVQVSTAVAPSVAKGLLLSFAG